MLVIFEFNSARLLFNYWWFHLIPFAWICRTEILHAAGKQLIRWRASRIIHKQCFVFATTARDGKRRRRRWRRRECENPNLMKIPKKKQINIYQILCWALNEHIPVSASNGCTPIAPTNGTNEREINESFSFASFVRIHSRQSFAIRRGVRREFLSSRCELLPSFFFAVHNL